MVHGALNPGNKANLTLLPASTLMYLCSVCVPRDMAQLHVTRVKREFREIVTSEEVKNICNKLVWPASPPQN